MNKRSLGIDVRIILKITLKKWTGVVEPGFVGCVQGPVARFCQYGNELSGAIKCCN
jgi:hypothetical protein